MDRLDTQFTGTLKIVRELLAHSSSIYRKNVERWVQRLAEPQQNTVWKRNRNVYALHLLDQLSKDALGEPFIRRPDDGPLPTLPAHIRSYYIRVSNEQMNAASRSQRFLASGTTGFLREGARGSSAGTALSAARSSLRHSGGRSFAELRASRAKSIKYAMQSSARNDPDPTDSMSGSVKRLLGKIYSEDIAQTTHAPVNAPAPAQGGEYGSLPAHIASRPAARSVELFGAASRSTVDATLRQGDLASPTVSQVSAQSGASGVSGARSVSTLKGRKAAQKRDYLADKVSEQQAQIASYQSIISSLELQVVDANTEAARLRNLIKELLSSDDSLLVDVRAVHDDMIQLGERQAAAVHD